MSVSTKLENLYKQHGLTDFKLRTTDDILKIFGIDCQSIKGFDTLDDENKELYQKFIVNFYNGLGLGSKATLVPESIFWVEDTVYLAKESPENSYWTEVGGMQKCIDKNGVKTLYGEWIHEDFKDLEITKDEKRVKEYLRFGYKHHGEDEWLRVITDKIWY